MFNDGDSVDEHEMAGLLTNEELLCMQRINWETGKGVLWNHEDAESGLKVMLMRKLESQTPSDGNVTKKVSILMLEAQRRSSSATFRLQVPRRTTRSQIHRGLGKSRSTS